jgi:pentatricopeptide repeat protein
MTSPFICASCRRNLPRRALPLATTKSRPRAFYHSFVDIVPPPPDDKQLAARRKSAQTSAAIPIHINFDELFLNREALKKPSRYSETREKDRFEDGFSEKSMGESVGDAAETPELGRRSKPTPTSGHGARVINGQNSAGGLSELKTHSQPPGPSNTESMLKGDDAQEIESSQPVLIREVYPEHPAFGRSPIAHLKRLLVTPSTSGQDVWVWFKKNFPEPDCSALTRLELQDQVLIAKGEVFGHLLGFLTKKWLLREETSVPRPVEVIERLEYLKVMTRLEWHSRAIWRLVVEALRSKSTNTDKTNLEWNFAIVEELASLWALLFRQCTSESTIDLEMKEGGTVDWSGLPKDLVRQKYGDLAEGQATKAEAEQAMVSRLGRHKKIGSRLFDDLQGRVPDNVIPSLAISALATFTLLNEHRIEGKGVITHEPFQKYLAHLLYRADTLSAVNSLCELLKRWNFTPRECQMIRQKLVQTPSKVMLIRATESAKVVFEDTPMTLEENESLEDAFHKKIALRLAKGSLRQIIALWAQARRIYTSTNGTGDLALNRIPPDLYARFLYAFSRLKRTDMTDEVWNHMVASGVEQSAAHWGALMKGRQMNAVAVEEIWLRMVAGGILPDGHTWSARIHSLIAFGKKADAGLNALEKMGINWLEAVGKTYGKKRPALATVGDLPGAPKPNVVTLNAAVNALSRRSRKDRALFSRVFSWASQFGIKPNERTYNVLIKECLRDGNMREAMKILGRMEEACVPPDGATFGMFINHIFRQRQESGEAMNPEQQEAMLASILRVLEERGMSSSEETMGLMFDILVKQHNNLEAAQRVLDYMAAHGMKPNPHIYTILMTHHFQQGDDPDGSGVPDFAAIEALWSNIENTGGIVDHIFYDRMIEGYARAGEVGQAMTFLGRMGRESKKPGWQALTMLVKALVEAGQLDRVREIVDDVENYEGNVRGGVRGYNRWGDRFWEEVRLSGIRRVKNEVGQGEGGKATVG